MIRALRYVVIIVAAQMSTTPSVHAGQCLADLREVDIGGGQAVKLRDFACKSDAGELTTRVQFLRLSDILMNEVLDGTPPPGLAAIIKQPKIIETEALAEFKSLMREFGVLTDSADCKGMSVETPSAGKGFNAGDNCADTNAAQTGPPKALRTLGGWGQFDADFFPAPDLTDKLPVGGTIWRSLKATDIDKSARNLRQINAKIRAIHGKDDLDSSLAETILDRIALESKLTEGRPPNDYQFLFGIHDNGGCDGETNYRYVYFFPRPLVVEVAIIENIGSEPTSFNDFEGLKVNGKLRPSKKAKGGSDRLPISSVSLGPGERAVVPLKLLLVVNDGLRDELREGQYSRMSSKPKLINFDYGPELSIAGFSIGGESYRLEESSANLISMTFGSSEGSCPFLYSWDEKENDWVNHDKVLHHAKGKALEQSDSKTFAGLRTKFRLAELEPELAHIDQAELDLHLADGKVRTLTTSHAALAHRDGRYARLYWGEQTEFAFDLPDDLKAADVAKSVLRVKGYYDRYSDLLAAAKKPRIKFGALAKPMSTRPANVSCREER